MEGRIQFNLLPDTKAVSVKSQKNRRLITSVAIMVTAVSVAVFLIMLLVVDVVQKKQLSDADKQLANYSNQLKSTENLDKILTVQNQLNTLTTLHRNKHLTSRIFDYLPQITPVNISLTNLSLDATANTIQIDGTADSQKTVNTYVDTLKFTKYILSSKDTPKTAFPSVVESSFGINAGKTSFSLNVSFDPVLFSNSNVDSNGVASAPSLIVPKLTTTRSVIDDPSNALFNGQSGVPAQ